VIELIFSPVEIMQTGIRAKAVGVTTAASWLANFMIGQVSPTAFDAIGMLCAIEIMRR
jgi:hypothetical protein